METIEGWLREHGDWLGWVLTASLVLFIASLVAVPIIAIYMRPDYFLHTTRIPAPKTPTQWLIRITKNAFGLVFFLMGIAMLVLPGQGILTILIGMSLLDFPGKRALQLRVVQLKSVRRSIDWMRRKANREPLELP